MIFSMCMAVLVSGTPVYDMSEEEVGAYVRDLSAEQGEFSDRLKQIISDTIGTPYRDGPLGEGPAGTYDKDPLIDLKRVDCVTYVEQTVAMADAQSYQDLLEKLQRIRYRKGRVDYESRNHFMITDWVRNNPWCRDITTELGVKTETVSRTISRKDFFARVEAPGLGEDTPDEKINLPVVPTKLTSAAEKNLPDLSLVVFVGKVDWLFSLHCGLYVRDEDGRGILVHASSKGESVVKMTLADYMEQQKSRYIGFTAYKIEDPAYFLLEKRK